MECSLYKRPLSYLIAKEILEHYVISKPNNNHIKKLANLLDLFESEIVASNSKFSNKQTKK